MSGGSGPESRANRWWRVFRALPGAVQVAGGAVVALLVLGLIGAVTDPSTKRASATNAPSTTTTTVLTTTTQRMSDQTDRFHPSPTLTPGATFAGIGKNEVCVRGYTESVRAVSESQRDAVYRAYGIADDARDNFVIDHLIPLELGGSNNATNLWPEPRHGESGHAASDKDGLENELHDLVCSGEVSLSDAQRAIISWDSIDVGTLVSTTTTTTTTTAPTTTTSTTAPTTTVPPITLPPVTVPPTTEQQAPDCTPGYDPCIPPGPDVDCAGGKGNGPRYVTGPVYVTGSDPYDLDRDRDGIGCE